jgi:dihydroflavonol-4-reductase
MAHVLVTGATGFIASHCIVELIERGHTVRGTARSTTRATALNMILSDYTEKTIEVPLVAADLSRDTGWQEAVDGVDAILHVASPVPSGQLRNAEELIGPARDGTLRVLRAAKATGIDRVVMTSSMAAVAYGWGESRPALLTEAHWSNPDNPADNTAYARSKTIAERTAWDYVAGEGEGLKLTTINPSRVLGPVMGGNFSGSLRVLAQLMSGNMSAMPRTGSQLVDVRDVAKAHILALENEAAIGQRYLVADDFMWMSELADLLREAFPDYADKIPTRQLPNWMVRILSISNPALRQLLPELGKKRLMATDKIRGELGWSPISAKDSAIACAESLIAHKVV